MVEKEAGNPLIISNFEVNKLKNKVVLYVNKKIFPIASVRETASLFKEKAWVALEENNGEVLVELKPKSEIDLELLAREFNNELLSQSTKDIKKVETKSDDLISKIKEVVSEFLSEDKGRISKQSILTIGTILTTLGLAEVANASHLCTPATEPSVTELIGGSGEGGEGGSAGECCFIAGTEIQMADDFKKNIEQVKVGDLVKSYNEKMEKIEYKKVLNIDTPIHDDMIKLKFSNGVSNTNTQDHPYYVIGKGWCSYNPKLTLKRYKIKVKKLERGDSVYFHNNGKLKQIKLMKITEKPGKVQTYNLGKVEDNHTYFANGILVHNKDGEGCCFASDQVVLISNGMLEISRINTNDKIISYDEKTNKFTTSTVGEVIVHDGKKSKINNFIKDPLVKLSVKVNNKIYETKVTDNHPYFDPIERRYKQLKNFKIGDMVKTIDGEALIVGKEVLIDANSPASMHNEIVYNLHMKEGPKNYVVNGAVVHNEGGK